MYINNQISYIALFTILGYKRNLLTKSIDELNHLFGTKYSEIIEACITFNTKSKYKENDNDTWKNFLKYGKKIGSYINFADTIIFYSKVNDHNLGHMLLTANKLISLLLPRGLQVRGVITKGEIWIDNKNKRAIGGGIERAYKLEKIQEWCGAFVDPENIFIPDNLYEKKTNLPPIWELVAKTKVLFRYNVPFKTEQHFSNYVWCPAWPLYLPTMPKKHLLEFLFNDDPLTEKSKPKILSEDAQIKLNNTIEFFNEYKNSI